MARRKRTRDAVGAVAVVLALTLAFSPALGGSAGQTARPPLKVFVSVDMEGLSGVAAAADVNPTGRDYEHFRTIMAAETNAAIAGAVRAGATQVVVRDSHGSKMNLRPGDLTSPVARLIRGANAGPKNMMEGIDETFAAVVFIGYHAKAGTPNAVLAHTSNGNVVDFSINGVSLPEAGYNALVAGLYKVPVVFASGDFAFVQQARELLGDIEVLSTKQDIGGAVGGLSPASSEQLIRAGVERGVNNRANMKPFSLKPPYTMVLKVKDERPLYAGATRTGPGVTTLTHSDLLEILNAFNAMK